MNTAHQLFLESEPYDEALELYRLPCSSFAEVVRAIRLIEDEGGTPFPSILFKDGSQVDIYDRVTGQLDAKTLRFVAHCQKDPRCPPHDRIDGVIW